MKFSVAHRLPGRLRVRGNRYLISRGHAAALAAELVKKDGVKQAKVSHRTGGILIHYENIAEQEVISILKEIDLNALDINGYSDASNQDGEAFALALVKKVLFRYAIRPLLPVPWRTGITLFRSAGFIKKGLHHLLFKGQLDVEVLDATAIGSSLVQGSFDTASSIMFLLTVSEMMEEWTKKKSRQNLTESLSLNVDKVWILSDGEEVAIPFGSLKVGDHAVIRSGSMIPVDGAVIEGEAMVNQAMMTGEPLAVKKSKANTVFAGTVVEEGKLTIEVRALKNDTRINQIVKLIDDSEKYKSAVQSKNERLADAIVPYSFLGAAAVYLFTGSFAKAASMFMVDYSCAIKLSSSLSVMGAMNEASRHSMFVKGGRFFEEIAAADTIVFDKTGTLTNATPTVKKVIAFDDFTEDEVLCVAACLEEHFPHSVARAVVKKAEEKKLAHPERHTEVKYIVAHGIVSSVEGHHMTIGSDHFIFDDEGVKRDKVKLKAIEKATTIESVLYLAKEKTLIGAILIEDPIKETAPAMIRRLKEVGFGNIVMLTGDSERTAAHVAESLGIDSYQAQMLPEGKANYIRKLKDEGHRVIMVGDGVNDTPALSEANTGIAMKDGSDIAREVADVALMTSQLSELVNLRKISSGLMNKIQNNFSFAIGFNSLLLGLGLGNVITASQSALLHNASTLGLGIYSLQPIVKEEISCKEQHKEAKAASAY